MFQRFAFALISVFFASGFARADDYVRDSLVWQGVGDEAVVVNSGGKTVIENDGRTFTGGPNLLHGNNAPTGFNNNYDASMPLLTAEIMEDDGGEVLAVSRTNRKYASNDVRIPDVVIDGKGEVVVVENSDDKSIEVGIIDVAPTANQNEIIIVKSQEVAAPKKTAKLAKVEVIKAAPKSARAAAAVPSVKILGNSVSDKSGDWVVSEGRTLREVLSDWCDRAGWDLVWNNSREYPVAANAVFEGKFMDVSSALIRNFSRATPAPYGKFYKGNKVLLITESSGGEN